MYRSEARIDLYASCLYLVTVVFVAGYPTSDIDECSEQVDECDQNCHNNEGSYSCSCNFGFTLNDELYCDGNAK